MRKSKYLGKQFGSFTCTKVKVSYAQSVFYKGTKERVEYPHHLTYAYELTSNTTPELVVMVNHKNAAKLYRGEKTIDEILKHTRFVDIRLK